MKTLWMSGAAAVMAISIAGVQAQSSGAQTPPQTPPAGAQATSAQVTTVRGCVYEEKSIPGRSPNVAERAGVLEDYILVASNAAAAPGTAGTSGAAGTSGSMAGMHKAFKLEHAADEQLKAMVGKMVEVTGKIDAEKGDSARATGASGSAAAGAARSAGVGPDKLELPEFEVTSIKEIPGTCPATPDIKK